MDSSGSAHTAHLSNGVAWIKEIDGGGISANAADEGSLSIPAIDLHSTGAVTIAFWAKRTYSTAGDDVLFEATRNYENSTTGFVFLPDDDFCHGIQVALRGNEGKTANCYSQPSSGVWHHLAVVLDKGLTGGSEVAFYVDGVLQTPSWSVSASTNTNNFGNDPIYFFSRGGASQFSSGAMNDLRIYSQALTASQIQRIYNGSGLLSPSGSISYIQGDYATPQTPQTTVNVTYTAAQAAGDLNVVVVGWNDSTATVSSVRDAKGNVYARAVGPTVQSGLASQSIYYAKDITSAAAGTNIVTVGFSTAAVSPDIRILEYSGADPNNPVDVTAANSGNSSTSSSGTATTTNATDLIFGANLVQTLTTGPGSGFSTRMLTQPDGDIAEDRMVTATGSYSATAPVNPSGAWIMQMVAFRTPSLGSFTISASPTTLNIAQGNQGTSTITTTVSGGFSSAISLSASGVPTGTTVGFNPQTIPAPGSGQSTMTITVGAGTAVGTYPITVTGNGGGTQKSTTVTLIVTAGPNFTISASPTTLNIAQGNQGTSTITTIVSGGFSSAISLSASGVPTGTTVGFSPQTIPAPGSGQSTLTITVGGSTTPGTYPITVTGNGGGIQRSTTVTLTVMTGTTTINYVQGNYATPQTPQTTVNVTYTGAQAAGDLNVVVVGWNDSTATVSSVRDAKGNVYARAVGPTVQSGLASQSIYYAKDITSAAAGTNIVTVGFSTAAVSPDIRILEYSGADPNNPVDVTAANSGNSSTSSSGSATTTNATDLIFGANLVQTLTTGPGSGFSTRMLTQPDGDIAEDRMVTATGSYSATAPVNPSGAWIMQMVAFRTPSLGSFTISASPTTLNIAQGNQGTSTITTTVSGGFSSAISLSASGVPTGTTVGFNPQTIPAPGSGQSTMTITVGAGTAVGTYPITVTGNGGGTQKSTTVTLTVTAASTFSISASPSSLSVMQGNQGTSTITTIVSGGFSSAISLSASGVPTGTTVGFNPQTIPAPGSGQSTMTITVGLNTSMGTYPITVTGNGGGIQQRVTVNLMVTAEVILSWSPSISPGIEGYNAYRSTISGGPYTKLNSSLIPTTNYDDLMVQSGYTYYYVTTAVNNQQEESSYSNESSATVP